MSKVDSLGNEFFALVGQVQKDEWCILASPVVAPLNIPALDPVNDNLTTVRRE